MCDELNLIISYIYINLGEDKPNLNRVSITIPGGLNATIDDLFNNGNEDMLADMFKYFKEDPYEDLILKLLKDELAIDAVSIADTEEFIPNRVVKLVNDK